MSFTEALIFVKKESLKAKRIMQLESQLAEARDSVCMKNSIDISKHNDENRNELETRTQILESQMATILNKLKSTAARYGSS